LEICAVSHHSFSDDKKSLSGALKYMESITIMLLDSRQNLEFGTKWKSYIAELNGQNLPTYLVIYVILDNKDISFENIKPLVEKRIEEYKAKMKALGERRIQSLKGIIKNTLNTKSILPMKISTDSQNFMRR